MSYSSKDKATADAVCATLESKKIRCWIAPRDVPPGEQYATSLVNAINESKVIFLILSKGSNASGQVLRELEEAVDNGIPIIPLRIEEFEPTEAMRYYIKSLHWLDAMSPPLERHLENLAESIQALLSIDKKEIPPSTINTVLENTKKDRNLPKWALALLVLAGIALIIGGTWFVARRAGSGSGKPSSPAEMTATAEEMTQVAIAAQPSDTPTPTATDTHTATPSPSPTETTTPSPSPTIDQSKAFVKSVDENGWKKFFYPESGFSITIPPSWRHLNLTAEDIDEVLNEIEETNPEMEDVFSSDLLKNMMSMGIKFIAVDTSMDSITSNTPTNLNVLVSDLPINLSLSDYLELNVQQLRGMYGEDMVINQNIVDLNGVEAAIIECQPPSAKAEGLTVDSASIGD
ncbi:MAG: toll/interleukin-1 receptor domain-containing protein [Anaerolineales bacterium]